MTRLAMFTPGPEFSRSPDGPIFIYRVDASNMQGPRPATDADREKYPDAWNLYMARADIANPVTAYEEAAMLERKEDAMPKRGPGRPKKTA